MMSMIKIVLLVIVIYWTRGDASEITTIHFQLLASSISPPLETGDVVGLRGGTSPLSWFISKPLVVHSDGLTFGVSETFMTEDNANALEYKFVIEKNNGEITWEGAVGPGGPHGNRIVDLNGSAITLGISSFGEVQLSPTCNDDFISVTQGSSTSINVLGNDFDSNDNYPLKITTVTNPTIGGVTISNDSLSVIYNSSSSDYGTDLFSYTCSNRVGEIDTALVSVTNVIDYEAIYCLIYENEFSLGAGAEWSESNISVTPTGSNHFLGQFSNQIVALNINDLPYHQEIVIDFDLYIINSWDGSIDGFLGPDIWRLEINDQHNVINTTFRNTMWRGSYQSFPGTFGVDEFSERSGAKSSNELGYQFYGDTVYRIIKKVEHSSNSLSLHFLAQGLQDIADESWGIDNVRIFTEMEIPSRPSNLNISVYNNDIVLQWDPVEQFTNGNQVGEVLYSIYWLENNDGDRHGHLLGQTQATSYIDQSVTNECPIRLYYVTASTVDSVD